MNDEHSNPPYPTPVDIPYASKSQIPNERKTHPVTIVIAALFLLAGLSQIAFGLLRGQQDIATHGTGMLVIFIFIWGFAILIWRVFRRSNLAFNLTLCIGLTILFMGSIAAILRPAMNRAKLNVQLAQLQSEAEELKQGTVDAWETGETIDSEQMQGFIDKIDDMSKNSSGEDKIIFKAVSKALGQLKKFGNDRDSAFERWENAGEFDASTLKSLDDVDARIDIADQLIQKQILVTNFDYGAEVINEVRRTGGAAGTTNQLAAALQGNRDIEFQDKISKLELEIYRTFREILVLLRDDFGNWEYDESDQSVAFEKDRTLVEYDRLVTKIDQLFGQQDGLFREYHGISP